MQFEKGKSGNPSGGAKAKGGRPKGSVGGRMQALQLLDGILGRRVSKRTLNAALAKELKEHPLAFFKTIIMPLLPKESKLSFDQDGIVEWKTLLEAFPREVSSAVPGDGE